MERAIEQMESMKIGAYVKRLRDLGYSSEIVELVESDIKYGLTEEQTGLYLKKNIKYPQMKVMSQCLRKGADNDFIQMMTKYDMDGHQVQVAIDFMEKGVPTQSIEAVVAKGENAASMRKTFLSMLSKTEEARNATEVAPEYVKELFGKIEEVVKQIQFQEERYDELNKKLKVFETSKKDEEVRNNLVKKLEDTESDLSSQQDQLNRANSTIARLRDQIDEKKEEMKRMQTRIDTLEDKLLERADSAIEKKAASTEETVKTSDKAEAAEKTSVFASGTEERPPYGIPVYYQMPVVDGEGRVIQSVPVERTVRKSSQNGIAGLLGKLGFMKKSRQDIVKLVAGGDLVPAQLVQIKNAIERGLTEGQLVELINNNVAAEKMKEIIEIAVLENSMA